MTQLPSHKRRQVIRLAFISLALAVATVWVYFPVRHHDFVNMDDVEFVTDNPNIAGGLTWQSVRWALTAGLTRNQLYADYWRPVSFLSHALDIELFGLQPAGHHLMNVGIHAAAAVLLFLVLQSMTNAPWRCGFVAGLFALHPLRVESVAWVMERKDVLSGLFFMLTLGAYTRYVRGPFSVLRYLTVVLLFALALMSKSMVVTLPFVLLLLDYWPLGRTQWAPPAVSGNAVTMSTVQLVKEKLPLFALAAAASVMTFLGQVGRGRMSFNGVPTGIRIANAVLSYVAYIGKMFWPTRLAVWYPLDPGASAAAAMVAGVALVWITVVVIRSARRHPWLVTGWFWYLGMLAPPFLHVIGASQGSGEAMADRFTYLPSIGLTLMLCWSVPSRAMERQSLKVATGIGAAAALAVCATLSRVQISYWKDSETLFRHALDVTQGNWLAQSNLGIALASEGRTAEAVEHFEQSLQIKPNNAQALNNLGGALMQSGRVPEAIAHYEQALRIKPDFAEAHNNLGNALMQSGRTSEAMEHLELAVQIEPDFPEAHYNLGVALEQTGRMPDAIAEYEQALRINPHYARAHNNLGQALVRMGRVQEAIAEYALALRIEPDFADAHNNLGNALMRVGNVSEAGPQYEQALRIQPDFAEAHCNLGLALVRLGRLPEATEHWAQAVRIKPDYAEAHYNLGVAFEQTGRVHEALEHYEQALRIKPDYPQAQHALARLRAAK